MTTTVVRPDLSARTSLSKSVLNVAELCQQKAFYELHYRRPFVPGEKVVFGSAVDAGVEVIVKYLAGGHEPDMERAVAAAEEVIERDGVEVDIDEVQHALAQFVVSVVPTIDWNLCVTQDWLHTPIADLGECDGHPDLSWPDIVRDVKTSSRQKTLPSVEAGFYALLRRELGRPIRRFEYITWLRQKAPRWEVVGTDVTDELLRWTLAQARAYVRAKRASETLNAKARAAVNFTFPGGPAWPGMCSDCQYAPANGGPCDFVFAQEVPA